MPAGSSTSGTVCDTPPAPALPGEARAAVESGAPVVESGESCVLPAAPELGNAPSVASEMDTSVILKSSSVASEVDTVVLLKSSSVASEMDPGVIDNPPCVASEVDTVVLANPPCVPSEVDTGVPLKSTCVASEVDTGVLAPDGTKTRFVVTPAGLVDTIDTVVDEGPSTEKIIMFEVGNLIQNVTVTILKDRLGLTNMLYREYRSPGFATFFE